MPTKKQYVIELNFQGHAHWWLELANNGNSPRWTKNRAKATVFDGKAAADNWRKQVEGDLTEWDVRELHVTVAA